MELTLDFSDFLEELLMYLHCTNGENRSNNPAWICNVCHGSTGYYGAVHRICQHSFHRSHSQTTDTKEVPPSNSPAKQYPKHLVIKQQASFLAILTCMLHRIMYINVLDTQTYIYIYTYIYKCMYVQIHLCFAVQFRNLKRFLFWYGILNMKSRQNQNIFTNRRHSLNLHWFFSKLTHRYTRWNM